MAKSLNRVQIIGNLGHDPELRSTPSGTSVCTLRIATTDKFKTRNGEWQEDTEWHNVVFWAKLAEIVSQYLSKGRRVYVEGRLKTRSWEKEGVTRYMTEIIAQNMIMLDGGGEGGAPRQTDRSYDSGSSDYGSDFSSDVDEDVPF